MRAWQEEIMQQDVDGMWEADAAAEWERLNAPDRYANEMQEASEDMSQCCEALNQAIGCLMDAQSELTETPMEAKVGSLLEALEELECEIGSLKEKYGRGERE